MFFMCRRVSRHTPPPQGPPKLAYRKIMFEAAYAVSKNGVFFTFSGLLGNFFADPQNPKNRLRLFFETTSRGRNNLKK